MSYSRSYTFGVSGSVNYPASENGGSVSYHDSVEVNLYIDTSPFDRSVVSCGRDVNVLTASVASAAVEMCRTRKQTAKLISKSIINGFFGMIRSELSQQKTLLATRLPMLLQDLKSRAAQCMGKKEQMHRDFERITTRYSDVFRKLDDNMVAALKQLDIPLFNISDKINKFVFSGLLGSEASFSVLGNIDFIQADIQITIAMLKKSALALIHNAKRNLEYTKVLNSSIEHMLRKEELSCNKEIFIPVLVIDGDSVNGKNSCSSIIISRQFPQKNIIREKISGLKENIFKRKPSEFQKNSIDHFLKQRISDFAQENSESANTKRIIDEMLRIWQTSQDTMIS